MSTSETEQPVPARRLLAVHAHPDDETLSTGGTLATYAARPDTSVTVVTCTLGEQGDVFPPDLAQLAPGRADQLGGYRIGELTRACAALGVNDHRFLGGVGRWRDSGMVLSGHGVRATAVPVPHPRAFTTPEAFDEQVEALVAILQDVTPQVVITYGADGGYGHPDHIRAHQITTAAVTRARTRVPARVFHTVIGRSTLDAATARLAALPGLPFRIPAPGDLPSVPDAMVTTRINVRAQRARQVAAMRAHATQIVLWPPTAQTDGAIAFALSNLVAQPLLDVEEYSAAHIPLIATDPAADPPAGDPPAGDLFTGAQL